MVKMLQVQLTLIQLVLDTVNRLSQIFNAITPTDTEIENIKLGLFRIYRIDVNKALLFDDKQKLNNI